MNFLLHYSISMFDRISRTTIGVMLICASFTLPVTADVFAGLQIIATYPLLTALTAWDPLFSLFAEFKQRFIEYHFIH